MRYIFIVLLSAVLIAFTGTEGFALTADEIVEKANLAYYYGGDDGKARVRMVTTDKAGRDRVREMTLLRLDLSDGGKQKYYVYFHKPTDIAGMVFMVWRDAEGTDERWLYIPAVDLVKRVASKDKRTSFAGSYFTYEDVSGRSVHADTHELTGEDTLGEREVYVIKNTPKDADSVEFSYYLTWIDKENFIPIKGEYYGKDARLLKTMTVEEVVEIDGIPTVVKGRATLAEGGETVVEFTDVEYNLGIKENTFTERYLRKPPRKLIK